MSAGTTDAGRLRGRPTRIPFAVARADLHRSQKPGHGVPAYLRWVNRRLGRQLAAAAAALGLTPAAVTLISGAVSLIGIVVILVAPLGILWTSLAAALFLLGYALDSADGQLARLTGSSSAAGEWLDHVVDAIRQPAIHLAIAVALLRTEGFAPAAVLALLFALVSSGWFFAQILAEQLGVPAPKGSGESPAWMSFAKLPLDTAFLYFLIPLLALPLLFSLAYGALLVLTAGVAVLSMTRKYAALSRGAARQPEATP